MSDIGDSFAALKEHSQHKRASNRESSAHILRRNHIYFESKNGGAHLIVKAGDRIVDFWTGTWKYIVRKGCTGRGVYNLIRELGV